MNAQRVLVTGASGFVGQRVSSLLESLGASVVKTSRSPVNQPGFVQVSSLDSSTDWSEALHGCASVVHLAARVHVMNETASDPLQEFRRTNVEGVLRLATQAAECGVKRFVFVSSVKVNGEEGHFTEQSNPCPVDPYGVSKHEAERALLAFGQQSGLEVVIVRPPLVYGPGVKANFLNLMVAVARGIPLPLGAIQNKRSLVFVGNLAHAVVRCLEHPAAVGRTYFVSDNCDISTPELIKAMGRALGRGARLLAIPPAVIRLGATLLGRRAFAQRLLGDLTICPSALITELEWVPPYTMDEGLKETAHWYLQQSNIKALA